MAKTNYSAYTVIKKQLFDMFRNETLEQNRLPSEAQLAEILDVSISTLREVLMVLALEGYITKKHGVGNFLHPSTFEFGSRSIFFVENLRNSGYQVELKVLSQRFITPDEALATYLNMQSRGEMLESTTVYYADGDAAIFTQNYIPREIMVKPDRKIEQREYEQLHDMIWRNCRKHLAHSLNEYLPVGVPESMATLFKLPIGTPIIANRQVFYDVGDEPVMYGLNHFYPHKYKVHTLQNWALGQTT